MAQEKYNLGPRAVMSPKEAAFAHLEGGNSYQRMHSIRSTPKYIHSNTGEAFGRVDSFLLVLDLAKIPAATNQNGVVFINLYSWEAQQTTTVGLPIHKFKPVRQGGVVVGVNQLGLRSTAAENKAHHDRAAVKNRELHLSKLFLPAVAEIRCHSSADVPNVKFGLLMCERYSGNPYAGRIRVSFVNHPDPETIKVQ